MCGIRKQPNDLSCLYLRKPAAVCRDRSRRVKSEEDFTVAGRSLSPWVMVCTMLAVWIGTGSIEGNAEQTYKTGMAALIQLSLIARCARNIVVSPVWREANFISRVLPPTASGLEAVLPALLASVTCLIAASLLMKEQRVPEKNVAATGVA